MGTSLKFVKISGVALMLASAAAFTLVPISWDVAHAKGGNGNGNSNNGGNGNGGGNGVGNGGDHSNNGKGGGVGRSDAAQTTHGNGKSAHTSKSALATVEEVETVEEDIEDEDGKTKNLTAQLGWLNAGHASETALANAAPNSAVGRVAAYRDAVEGTNGLEADVTAAENELSRLEGLTDAEIAEEFPDGGYNDAVTAATDAVTDAETALSEAPTAEEALDLIDGQDLSEEAIAALHDMLGL